jgi:hypothetical protein
LFVAAAMEAPSQLPYNAIEEAVIDRGLVDFAALGPAEMTFFLCDALSADPLIADEGLVEPRMYYYERAIVEARRRPQEQREAAASIDVPIMEGPGGNLVAFAVYMFLEQTDFTSAIESQMATWAASNGIGDPQASNEALAAALSGVLALDRPLPVPDVGEPVDAYYQRALPAAAAQYLFRLDGQTEQQQRRPWPYYRLFIGGQPSEVLYAWWWLDPLAYFSADQNLSVDESVDRMLVGLLPIAGNTVDARVANWERDYNPVNRPWERAPAIGSAADPCARARGDLNAIGLSTIVVGPNQAAIAEAPLAASLAPTAAIVGRPSPRPSPQQQQRPFQPATPGFDIFQAPPTPLPTARGVSAQQQQGQEARGVSAKRRREALDAGALAAAAMGASGEQAQYPTPTNIALATLGSRVNPLARRPIDAVEVAIPPDACNLCRQAAIPSDVLDYLVPNWNAWEAARGTAFEYRQYVLELIDEYQRLGPPERPGSPGAEPARRRRRLSQEEGPRGAPGVGNIVTQILGDTGLVNAYGVGPLLGMIDAWSQDPVENEFYSAFIQGQAVAANVVCRQCAIQGGTLYAQQQQNAPRATIEGARMTFPFPPLPGLPVVAPTETGAFPGPFILAGSVPVGTLASYQYGRGQRGIQSDEEVAVLGGAGRSTGYQIRQTWFDYYLGPYAIERGALVFYRPETHLFEAALAPTGAPPLPLALGRVVEYDTSHFDVVLSLGPGRQRLGYFPTRLVVQPLLAGVETGVVESVRTDNVYPYAAGAEVPTSQQVLQARGEPIAAQFAGSAPAATGASRGIIGGAATAQNLLQQRAALAEALASPALAAAGQDAERVRRLYYEIDERVRALGLGSEPPTSLAALRRATQLAGRESARQRPSSRVLAAAGRSGGPSARASLELAAAGAGGDIGAARANLDAALATIDASTGAGTTPSGAAIVGVEAPASPGVAPTAVVPGEVVMTEDGYERVLIDERAKWDVLFGVVLTKFGVLFPDLAVDIDLAGRSLLLAASLLGYAVPLTVPHVARLSATGTPPPARGATLEQQQTWANAVEAQNRNTARQLTALAYANALPPNTRLTVEDAPNLGVIYATLFRQAWNSIFDQEGLTTPERDQEAQDKLRRRLWAYPGPPNTLMGMPTFVSNPDRVVATPYAVSALVASRTDPYLGRLRDIIYEAATRYRWTNVFAGPAVTRGRDRTPSTAVDVGVTLRSVTPGASRATVHTFRPLPTRTASGVGRFVVPSTQYGRSVSMRMFPARGASTTTTTTAATAAPGRIAAQSAVPRRLGVGSLSRTMSAPFVRQPATTLARAQGTIGSTATFGQPAQDIRSTALLQGAYIYQPPGSLAFHVVVDPVTIEGLRAGDMVALNRLAQETARVTRCEPGSLALADLVPVAGTGGVLYQIAGPTRGSDPTLEWLRPSTVWVRDLLRNVADALAARDASRPPAP